MKQEESISARQFITVVSSIKNQAHTSNESASALPSKTTIVLRGIVDRVDMVFDSKNETDGSLRLIDYKSGKEPSSRNAIVESFEQLLVHALIYRSGGDTMNADDSSSAVRYLRLI